MTRREFLCSGATAAMLSGCRLPPTSEGKRWYKGALHCHTYWSDGRVFPEQAAAWYRDHGYQFVALTDHNAFRARLTVAGTPVCGDYLHPQGRLVSWTQPFR